MLEYDFEYDGVCLSDMGYVVCSFDGSSETMLEGSNITFNQTSIAMGKQHLLASIKYEECLTTEFDICKKRCGGDLNDFSLSAQEEMQMRRWLNRKKFFKFRPLSERYNGIYFNGSFNIQTKELGGKIIGMHLVFTSESPFGYTDASYKFDIEGNGQYTLYGMSDEAGDDLLNIEVMCKAAGDLEITNLFNDRKTVIKNCSEGEVISINNMIIRSSLESHDEVIANDFNFIFPMVCNDYGDRKNVFKFSLPCSVVFKYKELRKIGI